MDEAKKVVCHIDERYISSWFVVYSFLIAWCISPPLSFSIVCRLLALCCVGFVGVVLTVRPDHKTLGTILSFACIGGYILITALIFNYFISQINTLIFLSMTLCAWNIYVNPLSRKTQEWIMLLTFILSIIWLCLTLSGLAANAHIMRLLVRSSDESMEYARQGIGGYGFAYTMLLLLPFALDFAIFNAKQSKILKNAAILFIIIASMVIIKSGYFLAVLLLLSTIPLYLIYNSKQSTFCTFVVVIILGIFMIFFYDDILHLFKGSAASPGIQRKIQDVSFLLNDDIDLETSEFATRSERYLRDIHIILRSPFSGCLDFLQVGKHSHILDFISIFGIPFSLLCLCYYGTILDRFRIKENPAAATCITLAVLLLSMNSLSYSFGAVLFIYLPIYCMYKKTVCES